MGGSGDQLSLETSIAHSGTNSLKMKRTDEEYLAFAADIATFHHERWDGTGYPCKLQGEQIPLSARIMAIADVFDALVSERCYKQAMTHEQAYKIIEEEAGSHFDPHLAEVFLRHKEDFDLSDKQ